jgi:hypothetical protein
MFVISCHADTGFPSHRLTRLPGGVAKGHLDNFAGVHAVMTAYFSGRLCGPDVRVELTHGEEVDMAGAREVCTSLDPADTVLVVDVTAAPAPVDFTIEKCADPGMRRFVRTALKGMRYRLYAGCPDPVAQCDESDVYRTRCRHVCFLGIPCHGGDYNAGVVRCRLRHIQQSAEAICRLVEHYQSARNTNPVLDRRAPVC